MRHQIELDEADIQAAIARDLKAQGLAVGEVTIGKVIATSSSDPERRVCLTARADAHAADPTEVKTPGMMRIEVTDQTITAWADGERVFHFDTEHPEPSAPADPVWDEAVALHMRLRELRRERGAGYLTASQRAIYVALGRAVTRGELRQHQTMLGEAADALGMPGSPSWPDALKRMRELRASPSPVTAEQERARIVAWLRSRSRDAMGADFDDPGEVMAELADAIERGDVDETPAPTEWVSIAERMPTDGAPVWLAEAGSPRSIWGYSTRGAWCTAHGAWLHTDGAWTHWRPREPEPAPPPARW